MWITGKKIYVSECSSCRTMSFTKKDVFNLQTNLIYNAKKIYGNNLLRKREILHFLLRG